VAGDGAFWDMVIPSGELMGTEESNRDRSSQMRTVGRKTTSLFAGNGMRMSDSLFFTFLAHFANDKLEPGVRPVAPTLAAPDFSVKKASAIGQELDIATPPSALVETTRSDGFGTTRGQMGSITVASVFKRLGRIGRRNLKEQTNRTPCFEK
jgi:hypothetical protein